jgi:hypothetical protein
MVEPVRSEPNEAISLIISYAMLMQSHVMLMQGDAMPMQSDAILMQSDVMLMQGDAMPMQSDAMPMQGDVMLMQGDAMPMQSDAMPMHPHTFKNATLLESRRVMRVQPYFPTSPSKIGPATGATLNTVRIIFFDENYRSQRRDKSPSLQYYCRDGDLSRLSASDKFIFLISNT